MSISKWRIFFNSLLFCGKTAFLKISADFKNYFFMWKLFRQGCKKLLKTFLYLKWFRRCPRKKKVSKSARCVFLLLTVIRLRSQFLLKIGIGIAISILVIGVMPCKRDENNSLCAKCLMNWFFWRGLNYAKLCHLLRAGLCVIQCPAKTWIYLTPYVWTGRIFECRPFTLFLKQDWK